MHWWIAVLIAVAGAGACVLFDYLALVAWPGFQRPRDEIVQPPAEDDRDRQRPPGEPT